MDPGGRQIERGILMGLNVVHQFDPGARYRCQRSVSWSLSNPTRNGVDTNISFRLQFRRSIRDPVGQDPGLLQRGFCQEVRLPFPVSPRLTASLG